MTTERDECEGVRRGYGPCGDTCHCGEPERLHHRYGPCNMPEHTFTPMLCGVCKAREGSVFDG